MFKRIPQLGTEITLRDLFSGYKGIFSNQKDAFSQALSGYLSPPYLYLLNSGTAAFYIILKALRSLSPKREVILPAYTAPAMILPILKLGLKPALCDISPSDFNMDLDLLPGVITPDTLCIVPTHLFGIVNAGIKGLKHKVKDVFIIEDCAQSLGSKIGEENTGSFSDIGFLSFNRGKNLPTYGGGAVFTDSSALAKKIKSETDALAEQGLFFKFALPLKIAAFSLAVRPEVYGLFYPVIWQFKDNRVPESFPVQKFTNFQAGIGAALLKKINELSERRYLNGTALINGLADIKQVAVPKISEEIRPAFNRLPILFKDSALQEKAKKKLFAAGVDTSRMYVKPLHHLFNLGYKKEDFPNAVYFAERLLTLPTHPLLRKDDLNRIIGIIRNT